MIFIIYFIKFHKVVRQQNSGAVEDYSLFRSLSTNPTVKE